MEELHSYLQDLTELSWVGLGWVGLGWVGLGLGWVGLGWVGLGWVGLGRDFQLAVGWVGSHCVANKYFLLLWRIA